MHAQAANARGTSTQQGSEESYRTLQYIRDCFLCPPHDQLQSKSILHLIYCTAKVGDNDTRLLQLGPLSMGLGIVEHLMIIRSHGIVQCTQVHLGYYVVLRFNMCLDM